MYLTFTEVVPRTVFSFNCLHMLANGPPLFGSGVFESISSSAAVEVGIGVLVAYLLTGTSCKHVRVLYTPLHPILYSRIGVYRGVYHFSYFSSNTKIVGTRNEYPQSVF